MPDHPAAGRQQFGLIPINWSLTIDIPALGGSLVVFSLVSMCSVTDFVSTLDLSREGGRGVSMCVSLLLPPMGGRP